MSAEDIIFAPVGQDKTTELLIHARQFVERGWCRNGYARDENSRVVPVASDCAVAWCMVGALKAAGWNGDARHPVVRRLLDATHSGWIIDFNDTQKTVEPVLAAFDRAITAGS